MSAAPLRDRAFISVYLQFGQYISGHGRSLFETRLTASKSETGHSQQHPLDDSSEEQSPSAQPQPDEEMEELALLSEFLAMLIVFRYQSNHGQHRESTGGK